MDETDKYILKCRAASIAPEKIARKLSMSVDELQVRYERIAKEIMDLQSNGYNFFCDRFTILAEQYKLIGGSLMEIGKMLDRIMTEAELALLVTDDKAETIRNLRTKAMVFHPYVPPTPKEEAEIVAKP